MKLFLIRHGEAIDYETQSVKTDEYRFVTPKGRKISREVFRKIKEHFYGLETIFTSPLTRAVQTAEILANAIKFENDIEVANELVSGSSPGKILELIKQNSSLESIALIGHEPLLGIFVSSLSDRNNLNYQFRKSGVVFLDFDSKKGTGKFVWFFDPKTREYIK